MRFEGKVAKFQLFVHGIMKHSHFVAFVLVGKSHAMEFDRFSRQFIVVSSRNRLNLNCRTTSIVIYRVHTPNITNITNAFLTRHSVWNNSIDFFEKQKKRINSNIAFAHFLHTDSDIIVWDASFSLAIDFTNSILFSIDTSSVVTSYAKHLKWIFLMVGRK